MGLRDQPGVPGLIKLLLIIYLSEARITDQIELLGFCFSLGGGFLKNHSVEFL